MKRKRHYLLLLLLLITILLPAQQNAFLIIKTVPEKEFMYWFSGMDYLSDYEQGFYRSEKGKTDDKGYFSKEFSIDKPVTLNLGRLNNTIMTVLPVYLTPGSCDTITIANNQITFQGTNAAYNRCLQVTEAFMDYCNQLLILRPSEDPLFQTKSLPEFVKILNTKRSAAENAIKHSGATTTFIEEQTNHIDLSSRMAFMYKILYYVPDSLQTEEWQLSLKEIMGEPIDIPYFTSYRETYFILSAFLALNYKMANGNTKGLQKISFDTFELLGKHFSGRNLECAWATLINDDICQKVNNPIAAELYDQLKAHFPENTYQSFLEAGIEVNRQFNEINVADMSADDYHILSCDSSFQSLTDVVKSMNGKVVYVDIWATWCVHCLNQFSYLPQVREKTKDMDIVFLYLSMDKPENKERWKKLISHYSLKGYHLLATPHLAENIRKEFGAFIPHYVIVDKEGHIVEHSAPAPDQTDVLYEKLLQWNE